MKLIPTKWIKGLTIKSIIIILSVFWSTFEGYGQSGFIVTPAQVNLGAEGGFAEIQLEFLAGPFPWSLSVEDEWLTVDPMAGETAASLVIEYAQNNYLRRRTELVFNATDGSGDQLIVEVWQLQGLPPSTLSTFWEYLELEPNVQEQMPFTGLINFNYTPWETGVWLNIVAKSDLISEPVWIIPNIYLPDRSSTSVQQQLSIPFSLEDLGYQVGDPVGEIMFGYTLSFDADAIPPWVGEDLGLRASLELSKNAPIEGYDNPFVYNGYPLTEFFPKPEFSIPPHIDDYHYIGCEMPNGNLVSSQDPSDQNACVPAAAANSLFWLKEKYPEIHFTGSWRDQLRNLKSIMKHTSANGVTGQNFIQGKLDFIEMYNLPIKVKYKASYLPDSIASSTGNSNAKKIESGPFTTPFPSPQWIANELKDGEDVEIVYKKRGESLSHAVTASGFYRIGDKYYLCYKDDRDQLNDDASDLKQSHSFIRPHPFEEKWMFSSEGNALMHLAVSESFDSAHQDISNFAAYTNYCESRQLIVAPGESIGLEFPLNDPRNLKISIRKKFSRDDAFTNAGSVSKAQGYRHRITNDYQIPIIYEIHNDEYQKPSGFKSYTPWTLSAELIFDDPTAVTSPALFEEYAGFSVGTDDDSQQEFGNLTLPVVIYQDSIGASQKSFPQRMTPTGVKKLILRKQIVNRSRYWNSLGLVIGLQNLETPGFLLIDCPSTGYKDTLNITGISDWYLDIGGMNHDGMFELIIEAVEPLAFTFDNLGVPTMVDPQPTLEIEPEIIELPRVMDQPASFTIRNHGGESLYWVLVDKSDWFAIIPTSGWDEKTIELFYDENTGADREDSILILTPLSELPDEKIIVRQEGIPVSGITHDGSLAMELNIFPNPAGEMITVNVSGVVPGELILRIIDLGGKEHLKRMSHVKEFNYSATIHTNQFRTGQYILEISQGENQIRKFIQIR